MPSPWSWSKKCKWTFKAINTNVSENRMIFFKGYIKIRETAFPIRNLIFLWTWKVSWKKWLPDPEQRLVDLQSTIRQCEYLRSNYKLLNLAGCNLNSASLWIDFKGLQQLEPIKTFTWSIIFIFYRLLLILQALFQFLKQKRSSMVLLEMPGIEPGAFHMQSERATTALHPLVVGKQEVAKIATSE